MRRLNIPGPVTELARRAYTDAYTTGLETDKQRELYQSLLGQNLHVRLLSDQERPGDPREAARFDAQTLVATARQLEYVMSEIYEETYPDLPMAEGRIVQFDRSVPSGAQSFLYYVFAGAAIARFSAAYTTGDAPRAAIQAASVSGKIRWAEGSYGWHVRELRAAQFAGFPLEMMLAKLERRAHAELAQRTFLFGREDIGLPGMLTHPNITILDAPDDGSGSSRTWASKTFDLVARDIKLLVRTAERVSRGRRKTTTVGVPREEMIRLQSTFMNTGNGSNLTWLEAMQKLHPGVEFFELNELSASLSHGHLATDSAIAFVNDREVIRAVYPEPFLQHAPEVRSLETVIACESALGGMIITEPMTVVRLDGIGQS